MSVNLTSYLSLEAADYDAVSKLVTRSSLTRSGALSYFVGCENMPEGVAGIPEDKVRTM